MKIFSSDFFGVILKVQSLAGTVRSCNDGRYSPSSLKKLGALKKILIRPSILLTKDNRLLKLSNLEPRSLKLIFSMVNFDSRNTKILDFQTYIKKNVLSMCEKSVGAGPSLAGKSSAVHLSPPVPNSAEPSG